MRWTVCLGLVVGVLAFGQPKSTGQPQEKGPAAPPTIIGTITKHNAMVAIPFEARAVPVKMKFLGLTFTLREYPGRKFKFESGMSEHEGRSLMGDLKGVRVQIRAFCPKPEQGETEAECDVSSLKWVTGQPAAAKPAPPKK